MGNFLNDVKLTARMFVRTPGFTLAAILTVALGIAANTAIFSVVNTVLLKPFVYRDPDRIVMFQNTFEGGRGGTASPTEFNWWRRQTDLLQDISAYSFTVTNLTDEGFPEQVQTARVSADFFRLCGTNALHGRTFRAEDDAPGAAKTVVLANGFWLRRFGGNPDVIGRRMTLSGERYEIIGVAGADLSKGQISERILGNGDVEIDEPPDVYVPFQLDPNGAEHGHYFNVAARLKPGVTLAAANARLEVAYRDYARIWPDDFRGRTGFRVQPLQDAIVGGVRKPLLVLLGAVSFVLLIACANVAGLLLARATGRRREIAVCQAIGAGRSQIIRLLLTESLMLSLAGGILGVVAGYAGIHAILRLSPNNIPRIGFDGSNVNVDWRVLTLTLALSIVTGVLFGIVPALRLSRVDLYSALKEGGSRAGDGLWHTKMRGLLVTTEIAVTFVLLIGAALLVRTFIAIRHVDPGFDANNVLTMRMSFTGPEFESASKVIGVIDDGIRRLRALPGVEVAAGACCMPLEDRIGGVFQIAQRGDGADSRIVAGGNQVSVGYFETFRIPLLRGRTFTEQDKTGPAVVVISQSLEKQFWPAGDVLNGQLVRRNGPPQKIIGVVADVRDNALDRTPRPLVYTFSGQMKDTTVFQTIPWVWLIRTRAPSKSLTAAIENELRGASGGLPVARVRSMQDVLSQSAARERFNALVLTIFGGAALLLAGIGIYGLMAFTVSQRSHEIGIRLALGADSRRIRKMILRQGFRMIGVGAVCGLAAALGLTRLIAGFLFGVKSWDPIVLVMTSVILISVALVAVWLPAKRASRIDPGQALRYGCAIALLTLSLHAQTGRPLLLVVNKNEATLGIVDTTSGKLLAKVPTGDAPHEVAASNDGRLAFVTNYGDARSGNTLSVIDVASRKELRRVDLGTLRRPHGITVVDGKAVFTAEDARQIARYDPSTNRIDWRFDTGQDVTHMVLASRNGRLLFTSNIGSNTIGIIEQQANDWKQTLVRVGPGPEGLDLSSDGRELWTAHTGNGGVSIIDVSARKVMQTIDAGTRRANRLKFTPDGRLALISDMDGGGLVVIDAQSHRVSNRLPIGRMPEGILVSPDGTRAYVAVTGDNRIAVVDLKTLRITQSIETGSGPDGMAWASQ